MFRRLGEKAVGSPQMKALFQKTCKTINRSQVIEVSEVTNETSLDYTVYMTFQCGFFYRELLVKKTGSDAEYEIVGMSSGRKDDQ